jgi:hypothetical protein
VITAYRCMNKCLVLDDNLDGCRCRVVSAVSELSSFITAENVRCALIYNQNPRPSISTLCDAEQWVCTDATLRYAAGPKIWGDENSRALTLG